MLVVHRKFQTISSQIYFKNIYIQQIYNVNNNSIYHIQNHFYYSLINYIYIIYKFAKYQFNMRAKKQFYFNSKCVHPSYLKVGLNVRRNFYYGLLASHELDFGLY